MTNEKKEGVFDKRSSNAPQADPHDEGSLFERVVPDGIKRGFESLIREGRLKNMLSDLKLPKEIVAHIMSQIDETKQATLGVVSREVRLFLERTNLSEELLKLLTQISFEVKTQVRFVPNEKAIKAESKTSIESPEPIGSRKESPPPKNASMPPKTPSSTPPMDGKQKRESEDS